MSRRADRIAQLSYQRGNGADLKRDIIQDDPNTARYLLNTCYSVAQFLGISASHIDDVVQTTCQKVIRRISKYDETKDFIPWLTTVMKNEYRNVLRAEEIRKHCSIDNKIRTDGEESFTSLMLNHATPSPIEQMIAQEEKELLAASVEKTTPATREAVFFRHLRGMSYNAIARRLHIPLGTVKSRIHAGLAYIKGEFNNLAPVS